MLRAFTDGKNYKTMENIILISLMVLSVTIGAIADGFNERGWTNWGHPIEALEKPLLLLAGLLSGSWIIIISYVAFRIALFDPIKNIAKGQKWSYFGDSCWWDRFLSKQMLFGVTLGRIIFLAFAIWFTLKEL